MIVRVEIEEDDLTKEENNQGEEERRGKMGNEGTIGTQNTNITKPKSALDKPDYLKINNKFIRQYVEIERVENTTSSTAGAGSGDFHHYRLQRRKEKYRMAKMQWLFQTEEMKRNLEAQKTLKELGDASINAKAKRRKKKKLKKKMIEKANKLNHFADNGNYLNQYIKEKTEDKPNDQEIIKEKMEGNLNEEITEDAKIAEEQNIEENLKLLGKRDASESNIGDNKNCPEQAVDEENN